MKFEILTLFPKMFESPFAEAMIKRAVDNNIVEIKTHDLRQWAWNSYGAVDDRPYGGGVGMLIRVDVVERSIKEIASLQKTNQQFPNKLQKTNNKLQKEVPRIILMSARGKKYTQQDAQRLGQYENLIIICGRYEGFDERVNNLVDEEISIGDYVLTGGEIPAMILIDSVSRLLPGVLGKDESSNDESHSTPGYIEYPQYTRPAEYNGQIVPEELLSGDPKIIEKWKNKFLKSNK
jgi:tRNA (guanine37-N1)-methyltransferase